MKYLRIKGKSSSSNSRRKTTTKNIIPLIIEKNRKYGTVTKEKALSRKDPVLITGAHSSGKTRWLERLYEQALDILEGALTEPLDPSLSDDDFGHFIWSVPAEWVALNGCTEVRLDCSLAFLREATMRFSVENAIRLFLAK